MAQEESDTQQKEQKQTHSEDSQPINNPQQLNSEMAKVCEIQDFLEGDRVI